MKIHHEDCRALTVGCTADSAHCAELGRLQPVGILSQHFERYDNDWYQRQRKTVDREGRWRMKLTLLAS